MKTFCTLGGGGGYPTETLKTKCLETKRPGTKHLGKKHLGTTCLEGQTSRWTKHPGDKTFGGKKRPEGQNVRRQNISGTNIHADKTSKGMKHLVTKHPLA